MFHANKLNRFVGKFIVSVRLTHLSRNHPMNYVCYDQIKEKYHEKQTKDVPIGKAMV